MKNQTKAYFFAILSVFFWSTVATAFKLSLQGMTYYELLFFSSLTSLFLFFFIILIQAKAKLVFLSNKQDLIKSIIMGFLNPFLYYLILFKAYSLLPAQEALTLNYTWAIIVVILSIPMLKQKLRLIDLLSILISFFGVIIIATGGNLLSLEFKNLFGTILAVGSSFVWAVFWLLNVKDKRDVIVKLFLSFLSGTIFIIIYVYIFQDIRLPDMHFLAGAVYVGCFEMGITFVFWLMALKYTESTAKISNLIYLSPFLSLLIINTILGETIKFASILGLVLIIFGIITQKTYKNKI
jgi:drug/metabolite transporter (DMT)-like permease